MKRIRLQIRPKKEDLPEGVNRLAVLSDHGVASLDPLKCHCGATFKNRQRLGRHVNKWSSTARLRHKALVR